ncbi:MAG: hypothetical protein DMF61_07590 [Blastocatellia bacterium AA13]|nr:MAG: hypothetical protein DMF61_07590 [Blastocatellia bacterium AA13]
MLRKMAGFFLVLALLALALPVSSFADDREYRGIVRRGKNGVRIGDSAVTLFDGPGILNYEYKHRWMEGPGGAATVIGIGAGGGAAVGGLTKGKKGAIIGAAAGGGAATLLWLYKNRTERRKIF